MYDPRLPKIIRSLQKKYSVELLGWNREGAGKKMSESIVMNHLSREFPGATAHLLNFRAPAPGTKKLVVYYPLFWVWIFLRLCLSKPEVIHACDLDTFLPSFIYKILSRKKLIFDVHDRFAMAFVPRRHKLLYNIANSTEEIFSSKADVLVTVADKLLGTFKKIPSRAEVILNCCEDYRTEKTKSEARKLKIAFTGHLSYRRGLGTILSIVNELDDVELIIAGGVENDTLLDKIAQTRNANYLGLLTPSESIDLESDCDVIIALYDLKAPQDEYALPLKLWEAMMCGVPIITNIAQEVITLAKCGMLVDFENRAQIKKALEKLRDNPTFRSELGANGRKAYLEMYNWGRMEEKLYKIYDDLLLK